MRFASAGGLLNHICQHHGSQQGILFLSRIQRLTTCASLYGYCPSVGLDDCLLPQRIGRTARSIVHQNLLAYKRSLNEGPTETLPYRLNDEGAPAAEVNRLVQLRSLQTLR